jgi:hypothetical protein
VLTQPAEKPEGQARAAQTDGQVSRPPATRVSPSAL